MTSNRKKGSAN